MLKTLRKNAITIAMAAIACAVFTACGTGNDDGAVQPKEVVATKAVVTTTAETEAKTTTTTEAIEDSEPETTTEATKTTTTTEVIETSEPETEGTVQTSKVDLTATMPVETEEPKESNMMTVEDCIKKIVKENIGEEVVSIELDDEKTYFMITTNNGTSVGMVAIDLISEYDSGKLVDYNSFSYDHSDDSIDIIIYWKNKN